MFENNLTQHMAAFQRLHEIRKPLMNVGAKMIKTLSRGNKILVCGNGGSAADSQHFATEVAVRYIKDRPALPAVSLTTDTSILTAAGNDYTFDRIFSRQIEAIGNRGDLLTAISTSGNSPNVIEAVKAAKNTQIHTLALTGESGGKLKSEADDWIGAPGTATPRIQEMHIFILHLWAEMIETAALEGGL